MLEHFRRALDLAKSGSWGEAAGALDGDSDPVARCLAECFAQRAVLENVDERARRMKLHEIANLVSIALANLEAIVDGALDGSPQRYDNICEALRAAGALLKEEERKARAFSHTETTS